MDSLIETLTNTDFAYTWWSVSALIVAGIIGGFVNTIAGGGSMVTVPVMMLLGMPVDHANGTNRLGVLQQSITGMRGFNKSKKLDTGAIVPMLIPTVSGAALGAFAATWLHPDTLKPVLLGTMILIALAMLVFPNVMSPLEGTEARTFRERRLGLVMLFGSGLYGGFAQAGVGFILIAALSAGLRYDLVRANALKVVCTALFSVAALVVFIWTGHVDYIAGLILAVGATIGATASVKFAVTVDQRVIKWTLFVMICVTAGSALLFAGNS